VNRGPEFVRSVFPKDPRQLLLLFGVVSLFISPLLPWTSIPIRIPVLGTLGIIWLGTLGIQFSGAAGYFICLQPGNRSIRQLDGSATPLTLRASSVSPAEDEFLGLAGTSLSGCF